VPVYPKKDQGIVPGKQLKVTLDAYAHKREAEEFYERKDAIEERCQQQDFHFKMKNNGYLLFAYICFSQEFLSPNKATGGIAF